MRTEAVGPAPERCWEPQGFWPGCLILTWAALARAAVPDHLSAPHLSLPQPEICTIKPIKLMLESSYLV